MSSMKRFPQIKTYLRMKLLENGYTNAPNMDVFNTYDIIGRKFIMSPQEYGQKFRVRVVKIIDEYEKNITRPGSKPYFIFS